MKKRILCVILSLAAVFSLVGFNSTEAWFSDGKNKGMILESGDLNFSASDISLNKKDENGNDIKFLPGSVIELENPVEITNTSTLDTELRIKIECEYTETQLDENGDAVTDADGSTVTEAVKKPWVSFVLNEGETNWKIVEEDDCNYIYYYPAGVPESEDADVLEKARRIASPLVSVDVNTGVKTFENNVINFNGSLTISGDVPIKLNNKEMGIKLILQAKQADFMEWQNFGNPYGMPTEATPES